MPVFRLLPLALALTGALALPAHAQSLVELYESARGYDATWQGARAQYDASLARAAQAKAGILPSVGLSSAVSRTRLDVDTPTASVQRDYNTQSGGINAIQPLYRPINWATYEQSKRQVDIAQAQLTAAEQDLVVRVSQAYFDVLASQDSLALVRAQKEAVAEQLAAAKRNFEVGTSTITDSREAQARYDLVIAQEIAAENDLQIRKIVLDQLVGRPGTVPFPLAAPVTLPVVMPADVNAWVAQAEDVHPSIAQARLSLDVARIEVEKAQAGHKPTLDAQLGYNVTNNPQGTTTAATKSRINAASIGVQFSLPLFAGFAVENRIKETLALEEQSRQILESTRRSVTQSTRSAYLSLVSGAGQVRALEAAEASSQSALDANRLGYQVGVRINIDVLNSQSQLYQTRRDLAVARYNVLVGNLRLRQANGTLVADDLGAVNAVLATNAGTPAMQSGAVPSAATMSPVPVPPVNAPPTTAPGTPGSRATPTVPGSSTGGAAGTSAPATAPAAATPSAPVRSPVPRTAPSVTPTR